MFSHFPATADAFASSLAHDLLQRFWSYLFFIRRSFPADISNDLEAYRSTVPLAPSVLQAISAMLFPDVHMNPVQNGARTKGMRKRRATATVDTELFRRLGMDVPSDAEDAKQHAAKVIQDQRHILEVIGLSNCLLFLPNTPYLQHYLSIICRPSFCHIFKTEFISQGALPSETTPTPQDPRSEAPTSISSNSPHSAYPLVQPMKAALYFDSAVGFGDWRILLSTRATQNLREARRADAKLFKIIVKKIKFVTLHENPPWC